MFSYFNYFWKWSGDHPEKVNPTSTAVYFYILHIANSLNWRESFSLSSTQIMNGCGIANYKTYKKHFDELIENGFVKIVQQSKNQYCANVIALVKNTEAHTKALPNQVPQHNLGTYQSNDYNHKTIEDLQDSKDCLDIYPDSIESNPVTIQPDSIQLYTPTFEKKKVPPKKKDHRFADSIYCDDPDLFIEHWMQTETARAYPDTDPLKVYTTLKTSSDASSKYTYANWISAAQNWVKRNPAEYKRTYITASGQQLHHSDQAMLDRVERLTRNHIGG